MVVYLFSWHSQLLQQSLINMIRQWKRSLISLPLLFVLSLDKNRKKNEAINAFKNIHIYVRLFSKGLLCNACSGVNELLSSFWSRYSLQATPQQRRTAPLCPACTLFWRKYVPGQRKDQSLWDILKSPQRLTVSYNLDNLIKCRIILWGCIFASLKSAVKHSQLQRSYNFTSELLGGDTAPGHWVTPSSWVADPVSSSSQFCYPWQVSQWLYFFIFNWDGSN